MKLQLKKKLITTGVLIVSVIAVVEFQKTMQRQSAECVDGACKLPAEQIGAVVGPQSVPIHLLTSTKKTKALPRLIDFGAGTCATCKMMTAVLNELASEYNNRLAIRLVDTGKDKETATDYSIRMIPTQVFLDADGVELFRHEGFISKKDILKKWAELGVEL